MKEQNQLLIILSFWEKKKQRILRNSFNSIKFIKYSLLYIKQSDITQLMF